MAASAGRHQDQAVDAGFQRLLRMPDRDHVMQHDAAVAVDRIHHLFRRRAQRGNDDRDAVLDAHLDIMREAVVGLMHDLVDRDRPHLRIRIGSLVGGEIGLDVGQPRIEQFRRARIERRERADDAGLALRRDECRTAGDEERRTDHRQTQVLQCNW
jgi:hypothetical protein